jgi:hypothetical protein
VLGVEDGRVGEGPVEPAPGDVAVGGLREVDAVPAPVVGGVRARVRPRLAALGRQVEVVLAHARRAAARPRRLLQHPCARAHTKREAQVREQSRGPRASKSLSFYFWPIDEVTRPRQHAAVPTTPPRHA